MTRRSVAAVAVAVLSAAGLAAALATTANAGPPPQQLAVDGGMVAAMARDALTTLSQKVAAAPALREALDVPVRFAQANPPAFTLLFPNDEKNSEPFASSELDAIRAEGRELLGRLARLAEFANLYPMPSD